MKLRRHGVPDRVGRHPFVEARFLAQGLEGPGDLRHRLAAIGHHVPLGGPDEGDQPSGHGDLRPPLLRLPPPWRVQVNHAVVKVALEPREAQQGVRTGARADQQRQEGPHVVGHWLTIGAAGGRLFVRVFDINGNVRLNQPGDVLASITTMQWDSNSRGWNAGAPMDDANLNRRQTIRVGPAVGYAQVGVTGFDGSIDLQSLRLYGLSEAAPAVLNGTPLLPQSGQREFAAEVSWDLPSLAPGATSLIDVTVSGARQGDLASASLVSSTRFIELDAAVWSNNTVRVMARNISGATFDLAAATLSVGVVKRRVA